jgi:hypothetical protein
MVTRSTLETARAEFVRAEYASPSTRGGTFPASQPQSKPQPAPTVEDYANLAGELGFQPADLPDLRLRHYLAAIGAEPFDYAAVERHMDYLIAGIPDVHAWYWSPLRPRDGECSHYDGYRTGDAGRRSGYTWLGKPYLHTPPLHVLKLVRQIEDAAPVPVFFFVSDYSVADPDPFLMVKTEKGLPFVIAAWREPGWDTSAMPAPTQEYRTFGRPLAHRSLPLYRIAFLAGLAISATFLTWRHSGDHNPHPIARSR